jgi:hypothetical protein
MAIKSNASPDELSSPFYIKNKELCLSWEKFIHDREGKINATYNAFSLSIKAKVKLNSTWVIEVEKASYTSGNLFLSYKSQNLQEVLTLQTLVKDSGCKKFYIKNGNIKRGNSSHPLLKSVTSLLKDGFQNKFVYEVTFKDDILTIVIHHQNDGFEFVEKILQFSYEV